MLNSIKLETFAGGDGKQVPEEATEQVRAADWTILRSDSPEQVLLDATVGWLDGLPRPVRPYELAKRFPHITNQLCRLWGRLASTKEYLQDLLIDRRGNRRGFPIHVAQELARLKQFCRTLYPTGNDGRADCW